MTATSIPNPTARLASMDAYRGFVMICLAANGFGLAKAAENFPDSDIWKVIGYQFRHVSWVGCGFWDLIQPSFMFLVGVAMPYSYSKREATGDSRQGLFAHVVIRSMVLILLGLFLSSTNSPTTNFTFVNVLTQIGLGYTFLYLLRNRGLVMQTLAAIAVLGIYWGWFSMTPAATLEEIDQFLEENKAKKNWVILEGYEAHWQKHKNPAANFDLWFLNLFPARPMAPADSAENSEHAAAEPPAGLVNGTVAALARLFTRPAPYRYNDGGYQTLNFIPALVTMLFGLMAGEFIRGSSDNRGRTLLVLFVSGLVLLGLGWGWHLSGTCPLVKRIWTPSWTLFSTGWTLLMLSGFYGIIDGLGWRSWSFPLVVAGMNSMLMYMMGQLLGRWTSDLLKRHINENLFQIFGSQLAPIVEANLVLLCFWLLVYWLYRQRIFVKV